MAPNNYFNATLKTEPFIEQVLFMNTCILYNIQFSIGAVTPGTLPSNVNKHAFSHLNLDYNYVFKQCILTVAIAMLPAYTLFI